jgi:hypothetical protein
LPARINKKLVFALCSKCASSELSECNHSNLERQIEGTWVTEELKEALNLGYTVTKIFYVWHWSRTTMYDPEIFKMEKREFRLSF